MRYLSLILVWMCLGGYSWAQNNVTIDYVPLQLAQFKLKHPEPVGILTSTAGGIVDVRKTSVLNTNLFTNPYFTEEILHGDKERIPERMVHARGTGAHGYFVVTNDVSKYTKAAVFNGVGKKTPVFARFSSAVPNKGGTELTRDIKGISIKYYTEDGNFDHLCLHHPVYFYKNPSHFMHFVRAEKRNPRTNLLDETAAWDVRTMIPDMLHTFFRIMSNLGLPDGFRRMDAFPIHTFEIYNKHGERFYVRFNYRTEQGIATLTIPESMAIASQDPDYFIRDLYNAIENKNYPSWRLDMDVIPFHDLLKLTYDPFDVTKLWVNGTYHTVTIGRLVFDRNVDNFFAEVESSAFNPGHLVPGISGPMDNLFPSRVVAYRDTQDYRLGTNFNKIDINLPKYAKYYVRDGVPTARHNMKDIPNYHPNSFNGPLPYIDESAPRERLLVLESYASDLGNVAEFYNKILKTEEERIILAQNLALTLVTVTEPIRTRALQVISLVNETLGRRVTAALRPPPEKPVAATRESYVPLARCMAAFSP